MFLRILVFAFIEGTPLAPSAPAYLKFLKAGLKNFEASNEYMIAVISDSHIPNRAEKIPEEFREKMREADKTVHCGDLETEKVLENIEKLGEVIAVKGNCDRLELPNSETFEEKEVSFGVYHGTGIHPRGHLPTLVNTAEKLNVEVLLTGHTHKQRAEKKDGKVVLNPGSCTGASGGSYRGGNPEMMIVEVAENSLKVRKLELFEDHVQEDVESFQL